MVLYSYGKDRTHKLHNDEGKEYKKRQANSHLYRVKTSLKGSRGNFDANMFNKLLPGTYPYLLDQYQACALNHCS